MTFLKTKTGIFLLFLVILFGLFQNADAKIFHYDITGDAYLNDTCCKDVIGSISIDDSMYDIRWEEGGPDGWWITYASFAIVDFNLLIDDTYELYANTGHIRVTPVEDVHYYLETQLGTLELFSGYWSTWKDYTLPSSFKFELGYLCPPFDLDETTTIFPMLMTAEVAPVPEPATLLLLGTGLVGLARFRKKKFKP